VEPDSQSEFEVPSALILKIERPPTEMTPTTSLLEHRLVLADYEEIINASKRFAAEPQWAETTQTIVIEEKHEDIDDTKREDVFRAITAILVDCSKHQVLKAFKWQTRGGGSWTRPAEFWEALAEVAPMLQHFSFNFFSHELRRMAETGVSVRHPLNHYSHMVLMLSFRLSSHRAFLS